MSVAGFKSHLFCCFVFLPIFLFSQRKAEQGLEQDYLYLGRIGEGLTFDILQDRQGFMWFATEFGLGKYDGLNLRFFRPIPGESSTISGNVTNRLLEDSAGNIWVGNQHSGLNQFDLKSERFHHFRHKPTDSSSLSNNKIFGLAQGTFRQIWVGSRGGGLNILDPQTGVFQRFQTQNERFPSNYINQLYAANPQQIWASTDRGLFLCSLHTSGFDIQKILLPDQQDSVITVSIIDSDGLLWIGTQNNGIYLSRPPFDQPISLQLPGDDQSAHHKHIWDIFEDSRGTIWIGTDRGLYYLHKSPKLAPEQWSAQSFDLFPVHRAISIAESADGIMWLGTNSGVARFCPKQKQFYFLSGQMPGEDLPKGRGVTSFSNASGDQIWVGTNKGLLQYDSEKQVFHREYLKDWPILKALNQSNIQSLFLDREQHLWLSIIHGFNSGFGLLCVNLQKGILTDYTNQASFRLYITREITEDEQGRIWFANDNGLVSFDRKKERWLHFQQEPNSSNSLPENRINKILLQPGNRLWIGTDNSSLLEWDIDQHQVISRLESETGSERSLNSSRIREILQVAPQQLWIGTEGGLTQFNAYDSSFHHFNSKNGLLENTVLNLMDDESGNIWLSTPHYLARIEIASGLVSNYGREDGIRQREFWDCTSFRDEKGNLYFGGDGGMTYFHPNEINHNPFEPPVALTEFLLFNQSVVPRDPGGILPQAINHAAEVILPFQQNVFTLHFSALSYLNSQNNSYAYQLEGFDQGWQHIGKRTETTYTNLSPGAYPFKVKAANNDGLWGPVNQQLTVIVLPPWYRTWWAYGTLLLLLVLTGFLFYHYQLRRQLELAEKNRLIEMDAFKTQFYTNISHEFRTPLTVILGMLDRMKEDPKQWLDEGVNMIRRNGQHLLSLINQILDLSRLDNQKIPLHLVHRDIVPFLAYLIASLESYASSQSTEIRIQTQPNEIWMDFDPDKIQTIMVNLLSNAIKYTGEKGEVLVSLSIHTASSMLRIEVHDNGIGISQEELPQIFDQFFRSSGQEHVQIGSGLGLALTKQLVELFDGEIKVESELGVGSSFILLLPIRKTAKISQHVELHQEDSLSISPGLRMASQESKNVTSSPKDAPLILLVEDNQDVSTYLASSLASSYHLILAHNGLEGCEIAVERIPDIIISDVMMPKRDGFDLCRILKQDHRTSHIPIILLTAKADMDSRLIGLTHGADAYLSKPFHAQELQTRIEQLLISRKQLQAYYSQEEKEGATTSQEGSEREHQFVRRTRQLIHAQMMEGESSIERLAEDLHLSVSQFYRKIKALTGLSPSKFVRSIQLQKAKTLLQQEELNISDIAYQTGFSDPAYFSRVFMTDVGKSPSEFRNQPK